MTTQLDQFIARVEEYEKKATKRPWKESDASGALEAPDKNMEMDYFIQIEPWAGGDWNDQFYHNLRFIEYSRTDLPIAIALLKKYREALEWAKKSLAFYGGHIDSGFKSGNEYRILGDDNGKTARKALAEIGEVLE